MSSTEPQLASEDLDDVLEGPEPAWDDEPEPPPDADRANAMLWRLRRLRREADAVTALADAQVAQVRSWEQRRTASLRGQQEWLEAALRRYHQAVLARSPKSTSVSLPAGALKSRMGQAGFEYVDEAAFLAWATEHLPGAVRQRPAPAPEIDRNAAKDLLTRRDDKGKALAYGVTADGETPPGLVVHDPERSFDVAFTDDGSES